MRKWKGQPQIRAETVPPKKKKKRGTDSSECVALVMEVCRSALPLASISSIY